MYPDISIPKVHVGEGQNPCLHNIQVVVWHKYYNHYKEICENFIMPLYTLIFMTECNSMSEEAFKFNEEHGIYYLTKEGMYIRMYGCSRTPSLLPQYATDYVVHKEVVRQAYLDGVERFLFEHKKGSLPCYPFLDK